MKCYTCTADIKFDDNVRSQSGKKIPLNQDGSPHQCPNKKPFVQKQFIETAQKVEKEISQNPISADVAKEMMTLLAECVQVTKETLRVLQSFYQTYTKDNDFKTASGVKVENQKGLDSVKEGET